MSDLARHLAGAAAAHRLLEQRVQVLTDDLVAAPSLLAGWSVGHVLAHLAANASSHTRVLRGAAAGQVLDQYPGGAAARTAEIDATATRSADEHRTAIADTAAALEQAWAEADAGTWAGHGLTATGDPLPCDDLPFRRWRECVVHLADLGHVDAGLGITPDDWPAAYVREEHHRLTTVWASRRSMGLTQLPPAVTARSEGQQVAWLLGRLQIPGVEPSRAFQ